MSGWDHSILATCISFFVGLLLSVGNTASAIEKQQSNVPFFELREEEVVYGNLNVAMDGTVLLFSLQGDPHPNKRKGSKVFLKRSKDGGATWSKHQLIGKPIELDWRKLGIGPYDGKGWGRDKHHSSTTLGTSVVDESTGEIMIFLTALYPAPFMYKSKDHGETWTLEKVELKKDVNGFLPTPNAACDPAINIKHGRHKGRLLVASRVFPNGDKRQENRGYTNAVYSDDHGKTWQSSKPFPLDGTGESGLVELRDGTIYLNSRTHTRPGNRWVAFSDDSGESWRNLHQDDELFDGPPDVYGCKAGLLRIERDDRDILLFSSPTPGLPGRKNIRVWVSFDGGKTWPHSRLIRRGPGNYTWMTQGRKGTPSEGYIYLLSGKDWMARFNLAWLLDKDTASVLLQPRPVYRLSDDDLVKSVKNAVRFRPADPKLKNLSKGKAEVVGYRLSDPAGKGHVTTHRMRLLSKDLKIDYHAPNGKLWLWVMDESETRVRDSHALTGANQRSKPVPWQDGPLDDWVGKSVYLHIMLEGDAQIFGVKFENILPAANKPKPIQSNRHRIVLPPRNDYLMDKERSFVASVDQAERFAVKDDRLPGIAFGFRLRTDASKGHLLSQKFSLPSDTMRISCDASNGAVRVTLLDSKDRTIGRSQSIAGGVSVRAPIKWMDGFKLHQQVSRPVAVRFELEGDAKIYALRFDNLFWE